MATADMDLAEAGPQIADEQRLSSINYRNSLPGAPKPLCRQSHDESSLSDLYLSDDHDAAMDPKQSFPREPTQPAPAVPSRSTLRASVVLDAMSLKLDNASDQSAVALTQSAAPHDVYLSSEEDASSSADDFSDYGYETGPEENEEVASTASVVATAAEGKGVGRKRSHEDTARAVLVVFSGKPNVVTISTPPPRRPSPSAVSESPRRRSTLPRLMNIVDGLIDPSARDPRTPGSPSPSFLNTDPFACRSPPDDRSSAGSPPAGATSRFHKTLGLVRKRSRPFLSPLAANSSQPHLLGNAAYNASSASLATTSTGSEDATAYHHSHNAESSPTRTPRTTRPRAPTLSSIRTGSGVAYQDMMRSVKRSATAAAAAAASPLSPALPAEKKKRILSGLSMKRRSVKAG